MEWFSSRGPSNHEKEKLFQEINTAIDTLQEMSIELTVKNVEQQLIKNGTNVKIFYKSGKYLVRKQ